MADKVDLKHALDSYRARVGELRLIEVPRARYLAVDGRGDPNTSAEFAAALESLYPAAYTVKFASKARGKDYVVPPLEALWWSEDVSSFTSARDKSRWSWTVLSYLPDWIDEATALDAVHAAAAKRIPPRTVRIERLAEASCVQTLHVGRFDDEAQTLARIHDVFVPEHGLRLAGRHHEIYLSDRRRTPPERQRTILRQPVVPADGEQARE